ncbi:ribonuclease domain-containing protein [uncultured Chryseobacterium sp.]|uniref:ribonuclease domain-containing protein n=1 Tax=uncultured Chryseobacterium sp. TaxID=259322 RepID=UPI0025F3EB15|nr:ribonuclease domain-containing protein [uncultured Chryseobacterium sp.]
MNNKTRPLFFICLGLLFGVFVMYVYKNFITDAKPVSTEKVSEAGLNDSRDSFHQSIDQLTEEKTVIHYVKQNHRLPDYYITKNQARNLGWNPSKGNLCDVAPGKAIGGDRFGNRERMLPDGKTYFEADVNYHCGSRQADRIVFTKDGEVYLSKNHYKSFEKQ